MKKQGLRELLDQKEKLINHLAETVKLQAEQMKQDEKQIQFADTLVEMFMESTDPSVKKFVKDALIVSGVTMQVHIEFK